MSQSSRRRILIRGLDPNTVRHRTSTYNELYQGTYPYAFEVSESVGGWVQLEVPTDLSLAHFHNLAKWFEGDSEASAADDVITLSHGDCSWDYWLVPSNKECADRFLTGANA